jgi:hypothetical protein
MECTLRMHATLYIIEFIPTMSTQELARFKVA